MKSDEFIIALDQGTTNSRALLVNKNAKVEAIAKKEFKQIYPKPGWVEHDPLEILETQKEVLHRLIDKNNIHSTQIKAIGIANQRETTVLWNKNTGKPVYNAIVWQDKRTTSICEDLKKKQWQEYIKRTTGLPIDSYFSAPKIKWILDNVKGLREEAENGNILFGTIDTWLLWNLSGRNIHATDYSNASRTMLFDINNLTWDEKLLSVFQIPKSILPEIKQSSGFFGNIILNGIEIPVSGIAGDQQASLFGHGCLKKGMVKNTYGTGCFMVMNTGEKPIFSKSGLLTTIAWGLNGKIFYALEGSVFIAGAAIQWLRDDLGFIKSSGESEEIASSIKENNPVYVVPAFAGLGAPYWDMYSKGAIFGLTRGTGKNHIIKATLDSLAYQTKDVLEAMQIDASFQITSLKVDGGASSNNYLMQFQADILNATVVRPKTIELTALGAAFLAGLAIGFWKKSEFFENLETERVFVPDMADSKREYLYEGWQRSVTASMNWSKQ
ncbi:glycerol kinase GlpK [Abyssalbus ytuae]|uniref:Glycerol kinase n=1 Tax=Abyssalbus ytuae TaxID=2926907 RepID=A0A9E6ZWT0_9FLAO|nr:glycerol kinase GlpK [Abyssalbus ytuae]UOB19198.1 glycerol kinase GlpK [Abyssalbus ytuae]